MSSAFSSPRFSEIALQDTDLRLHLMSCPGIRFTNGGAVSTFELLAEDMRRLQAHNTNIMLSCLCDSEFILGVDRYAEEYKRIGVAWLRVPIPDMTPPSPEQDVELNSVFSELKPVLASGGGIAIHCMAGLGRTGTVAARFAMNYGLTADQAITFIRTHHDAEAIETTEQEAYLQSYDVMR